MDARTCRCGHPAYGHLNPVNMVMPVPPGLVGSRRLDMTLKGGGMCIGCPADLDDGGCPGFVEKMENGPDAPATSDPSH